MKNYGSLGQLKDAGGSSQVPADLGELYRERNLYDLSRATVTGNFCLDKFQNSYSKFKSFFVVVVVEAISYAN